MFDIVIIGGGMVGSATALGLAHLGLNIAVVESRMPAPFAPESPPDMRVSAISAGSIKLLEQLGAWSYIDNMRTCPVEQLAVWEHSNCRTDFYAQDIGADSLCHIVENVVVQLGLHQAIHAAEFEGQISWYCDCVIADLHVDKCPKVVLKDGTSLSAKLLIGADGVQSKVRNAAGIGVEGWQYEQQALGIKVKTHIPQQAITWQQFSPSGPMAFLPLFDGYASLVWYHNSKQIQRLKSLPFAQLKTEVVQAFPDELVDFDILQAASFPLLRQQAQEYIKPNVVLVGDAAHSINPLAGQGVNLGFKDVKLLVKLIADGLEKGLEWQDIDYLKTYQTQRQRDNLLMMSAMDGLYTGFSNDLPPIKLLRNIGLKLANHSGVLKNQAMRYAMGFD